MSWLLTLALMHPLETGYIRNIPTQGECLRVKQFLKKHSHRLQSAKCEPTYERR